MIRTPQTPARAVYIGTCLEPSIYSIGHAGATDGFDDPESAEHLAFWFSPDGEEACYYVDQADLSFNPYEIAVREHVQATAKDGNLELGRYLKYETADKSVNVVFEFQSFRLNDGLVQPPIQLSPEDHQQLLEKYYNYNSVS